MFSLAFHYCFRWRFHNLIQDNPNEVGIRKNSQNNLELAAAVVATADVVVVVAAAAVALVDRPIDLYF